MNRYKHGGDIISFAKKINCNIDEVIDLSSNINFIKPEKSFDFNNLDISSYPNYDKLYKDISNLYNINHNELEIFNGATSGIFSLFRSLEKKLCYIYSPAYIEYKKAANIHRYNCKYINRFTDIDKDIKSNSFVIFVNPSTPDGNFYDIDKLINKWIKKDCTILIDESFLDFCDSSKFKSATPYIKKYDKLYILKSMTKFYSSAGVRVGSILSCSKNIKKIKAKEPLWKISQFDSSYIQHIIKDKRFEELSKNVNIKNKEYLIKILKSSKYVSTVFNSVANFVMVELKDIDASKFQELLLKHKIMIRDCSNFDFLDSRYIRVAVKSKKALNVLGKALKVI